MKNFSFNVKDGVGILSIDVPGVPMNTWTADAIEEFSELVDDLGNRDDLKGIIIISGKSENFHAGANLDMLQSVQAREDIIDALDVFHNAFNKMENFKFPVYT